MSTLLEELPSNWKITTLGEINTRKAITLNPKKFADETFEYYSIPDYQRDQRPSFTTGSQVESSKLLLEPKTILFGKLNPRVEKVWRVTATPEFRQIGSTEWMPVLPNEDIDSDFLYFLEWSDYVMQVAKTLVSGSTPSRQRVDPKSFYQIKIPLPPLPEQKKIAHVLSTVQRAIEAQERIIQTTTELKKTLMHKLFTEGLRNEPQKQTEIGPVPESWELISIEDLFETQLGKMLSRKSKVGDSPKPYLRNKNVQWGRIDTGDMLQMDFNDREMEKFRLKKDDLLVCEGGEVGRTALWDGSINECYYQKALHRLRPKTKQITNEYMAHWMMFAFLLANTYGVTGTRTTIAHLPEIKLKPLLVPTPSPEERDMIVCALDSNEQKIKKHYRKHVQLQELFRTLLHELMTAKIRVDAVELYQPTLSGRK